MKRSEAVLRKYTLEAHPAFDPEQRIHFSSKLN